MAQGYLEARNIRCQGCETLFYNFRHINSSDPIYFNGTTNTGSDLIFNCATKEVVFGSVICTNINSLTFYCLYNIIKNI